MDDTQSRDEHLLESHPNVKREVEGHYYDNKITLAAKIQDQDEEWVRPKGRNASIWSHFKESKRGHGAKEGDKSG